MNINCLKDSVDMSLSFDTISLRIDFNSAIDTLAEKAGNTVTSGVKCLLKRSLEDTQKVVTEVKKGVSFIIRKAVKDCESIQNSATSFHSSSITVLDTKYKASKILTLQLIEKSETNCDELLLATKIRFIRAAQKNLITPIQDKWNPLRGDIIKLLWTVEGIIARYKNIQQVSIDVSPKPEKELVVTIPSKEMAQIGGSHETQSNS